MRNVFFRENSLTNQVGLVSLAVRARHRVQMVPHTDTARGISPDNGHPVVQARRAGRIHPDCLRSHRDPAHQLGQVVQEDRVDKCSLHV